MKTINLKTGLITVAFCICFVAISNAQEQGSDLKEPPTFTQLLKEMDKNEDGKLAKAELKGPLKDNFSKIDSNDDGFISEKEFKNAPKPKGRKQRSN
ncbi:EF-hand domain-containing protein [uncultured Marixanthomonas sp.]|mgnify:CR=1 FL=1|uniref:EF-hand domain-containing protein n=1 Tax=uncultured Marixanthomonas sp. TaxID=757245 RepID=UPI0030DB640D|tara:strand:+ start:87991 stop:88281 length:291 start_codon:yes stop_codon:yes gene_type:complete